MCRLYKSKKGDYVRLCARRGRAGEHVSPALFVRPPGGRGAARDCGNMSQARRRGRGPAPSDACWRCEAERVEGRPTCPVCGVGYDEKPSSFARK